jgi:DNA-binding transcriptional LysR family regulator
MSVELREMEMDQSVPLAVRGEIDVVVVNDWGTDPFTLPSALTAEHLGGDHFEVMLPEHHPAARRRQVPLAELAGETWIAWTRGSTYERWLVARLRSAGFDPRLGHYVEEHATQLALVAASLGVTLLPQVGRSPLPPGVVCRPTVPRFPRQLHAAYRTDDAMRPAIRATVAALQEAMRRAQMAVS